MKTKYFNKIGILSAICISIIFGGCKKYLDQQPITAVGANVVFSDVPSTLKAICRSLQPANGRPGLWYPGKLILYGG